MTLRLSIREASPEDSEFVFSVKKATLSIYIDETWGWDEKFQRDYHLKAFTPKKINIISIREKGNIGYLELEENENYISITGLYILEAFQNKGFGSRVIKGILERAESRDLSVEISVLKVNTRARQLYERLGFDSVAETYTHYKMVKSI